MIGKNNQKDPNNMSASDKHTAVMQQLDEIKRYVGGTYSKVDTEIDDIKRIVDRLDKLMRENDKQINRIEQFERTIRNIESTVRDIQRKVK